MPTVAFNSYFNSVMPGILGFDLKNTIDLNYKEPKISPVDKFISNATEINKLLLPGVSPVLGNLIILGYVSAIESYFRAVFKRLILLDTISKTSCEKRKISYGSVISLSEENIPEALFEDISFAGKSNILTSINNFLNLSVQDNNLPPDLKTNFNQFDEICQLRHCIIHRFGIFGSNNAINLGLTDHMPHIEKLIKCDYIILQELISICQNTVRITNNYLAEKIFLRLIMNGTNKIATPIWSWDYQTDKDLFSLYFNIFYSKLSPPSPKQNSRIAYSKYKTLYQSL